MAKKSKTHILFILDKSGSMEIAKSQTISGFNEYVETLKKRYSDGSVKFTLSVFDTAVQTLQNDVALEEILPLSDATYVPSGLTALYDAVQSEVNKIKAGKKDRVLVIIMTDGEENSSKEATRAGVFQLISEKESEGNWTFVFLGANQDSWESGSKINIAAGNTSNYDQHNTYAAFASLTTATLNYAESNSRQSRSFWREDSDK